MRQFVIDVRIKTDEPIDRELLAAMSARLNYLDSLGFGENRSLAEKIPFKHGSIVLQMRQTGSDE